MVSFFGVVLALLSASSIDDSRFHSWCDQVGIKTPYARLETTSKSVAGRGLFATDDLQTGDVAIMIPKNTALFQHNAALYFPELAESMEKKKIRFQKRKKRWWRRKIFDKITMNHEERQDLKEIDAFFWQAELALYCLACLDEENLSHPWAFWISQWKRSDPVQSLFENRVSSKNNDAISGCINELHSILPDVPKHKLYAAVQIRLRRIEMLEKIFGLKDYSTVASMQGILSSRVIDLGDDVIGVIPMFDMINHSLNPNLDLTFDGKQFELRARRNIFKDEELFICYNPRDDLDKERRNSENDEWDEDQATWSLVQWGIPQPKQGTLETASPVPVK